ncbi:glutamate ligase domain-containing protein [Parvularcula marina]|uniref:glutamate ligase domain-containing protein n=1 Tax=Parvularcula marina TaxID=2292771 RepID=UPI00351268F6
MIPLEKFAGQKVGVLGLGPGGRAAVASLHASGASEVYAWDAHTLRRKETPGDCVPPRVWPMEEMTAVILADGGRGGLSRGVAERAGELKIPVYTELDLFGEALAESGLRDDIKVIAVTGAAGKSVTISIISHILDEQGWDVSIGGDLGQPPLALDAPSPGRVYLLEVPVRRLAGMRSLTVDIPILLNAAGPRQSTEIALAMRALIRICRARATGGTAIIGVDDPIGQEVCTILRSGKGDADGKGQIIPVSGEATIGHGVFVLEGAAYSIQRGKTQSLGDFSRAKGFLGAHFNQDAAAAIAACLSIGIPPAMIIKSLHSYEGLAGRFECLGAADGIVFIDDSYASNPAAAERAINACPNVFWIGGDAGTREQIGDGAVGSYLLGEQTKDGEGVSPLALAFKAACDDAAASRDVGAEDAAPVVLFAPGVAPLAGKYRRDEFRKLVSDRMERQALHA